MGFQNAYEYMSLSRESGIKPFEYYQTMLYSLRCCQRVQVPRKP